VARYAVLGVPVGVVAVACAWDGRVGRPEGALLVGLYVAYVATIWVAERQPPALGETGELAEASAGDGPGGGRIGRELLLVIAGLAAMVIGATVLVDAVRALVSDEVDQVRVSLTVVGFVTGFELVVLAWSAARRGISEAVVAGVVGSWAYNATMTLGAAAVVRPLQIGEPAPLRLPMVAMVLASSPSSPSPAGAARSGRGRRGAPRRVPRLRRPRPALLKPGAGRSGAQDAELVALRVVSTTSPGSCCASARRAPRASSRSTSRSASSQRRSRWTRFFTVFGSGTRWNQSRTSDRSDSTRTEGSSSGSSMPAARSRASSSSS
jgi:hypothetical protein